MSSRSVVAQPVAEVAVGVERGVDAHRLRGREQLHREAVLHQRLAAAEREAARHDLQAVAVLAQLLGRAWRRSPACRCVIFQVSGLWQ